MREHIIAAEHHRIQERYSAIGISTLGGPSGFSVRRPHGLGPGLDVAICEATPEGVRVRSPWFSDFQSYPASFAPVVHVDGASIAAHIDRLIADTPGLK
jgi:hypothetical protein